MTKEKKKYNYTKKTGRPSKYTEELGAIICERISMGESLRKIQKDEDMPCAASIFLWLRKHSDFLEHYTRAKEEQSDLLVEEILTIADEPQPMTADGRIDNGAVQQARLRVDARKWVASKLKPKAYGDKVQQEVSGKDGGPLTITWLSE